MKTHGRAHTKIYWVWSAMLQRCNNEKNKAYQNYGGRGIKVCERWHHFWNFIEDMGVPKDGMTLDRIDNDKGYEPENCRWATRVQQRSNQRKPQTDPMVLKRYKKIIQQVESGKQSYDEIAQQNGYLTRQAIHRIYRDWGNRLLTTN